MKRNIFWLVVLSTLCAWGLSTAQDSRSTARDGHTCSNATLRGNYAFRTDGTVIPAGTRRVVLGRVTFDGNGLLRNVATVNDNGIVSTGVTSVQVYQINADCTGTTDNGGGAFIVKADGSEFYFMRTSGNVVNQGVGTRITEGR